MTATMESLIAVLLDESARIDERDDAAMDLWKYDAAADVLIGFCHRTDVAEVVVASCGESLAAIWKRTGAFDFALVERFAEPARSEIKAAFAVKFLQ